MGERALDGGIIDREGVFLGYRDVSTFVPDEMGLTKSKDVRESTEAKEPAQGREFSMTRRTLPPRWEQSRREGVQRLKPERGNVTSPVHRGRGGGGLPATLHSLAVEQEAASEVTSQS